MPPELRDLFHAQRRVATFAQIIDTTSRGALERSLRSGELVRIWPGIYSLSAPSVTTRLHGLDLRCGEPVAVCLHTAAHSFGFDTESVDDLHILNPTGSRLRNRPDLIVHRRAGVQLITRHGRQITSPAWTALEVARTLRRPRALATLDAALRSRTCTLEDLLAAARQQTGRRGIVMVRDLIPLARPGAESPMESEARLVMIDGGLPEPLLQVQIIDRDGFLWRVDFAWPDQMVAVEYDGFDYHSSPEHLRRDRQKRAALQELGWSCISIVSDDVRHHPVSMVRRINAQLERGAAELPRAAIEEHTGRADVFLDGRSA
jgi:REase_MTES_1575